MLTAEQKETLRLLHEGRDADDQHVPVLLEGKYIEQRDGNYHLTDSGLGELRLARGFGEAIADVFVPGAGTNHALKR